MMRHFPLIDAQKEREREREREEERMREICGRVVNL